VRPTVRIMLNKVMLIGYVGADSEMKFTPGGIPVATFAIGKPGAINAALFAAQILSLNDSGLRERFLAFRKAQAEKVLADDNLTLP